MKLNIPWESQHPHFSYFMKEEENIKPVKNEFSARLDALSARIASAMSLEEVEDISASLKDLSKEAANAGVKLDTSAANNDLTSKKEYLAQQLMQNKTRELQKTDELDPESAEEMVRFKFATKQLEIDQKRLDKDIEKHLKDREEVEQMIKKLHGDLNHEEKSKRLEPDSKEAKERFEKIEVRTNNLKANHEILHKRIEKFDESKRAHLEKMTGRMADLKDEISGKKQPSPNDKRTEENKIKLLSLVKKEKEAAEKAKLSEVNRVRLGNEEDGLGHDARANLATAKDMIRSAQKSKKSNLGAISEILRRNGFKDGDDSPQNTPRGPRTNGGKER